MENCCERKKYRSDDEKKLLINRLSRIEGQIRGMKNMVECDDYCADILVQAAAVNAAVQGFEKELLSSHIKTCVSDDIKKGNIEKVDELIGLIGKFFR